MKSFIAIAVFAAAALASPPADEICAQQCNAALDSCVAAGQAIADCTGTYINCLGFNPYDQVPFKKPTACRKETEGACAVRCNKNMDTCVGDGNAAQACTQTYVRCLGYNPYENVRYKKPTACRASQNN
ncbi:hypothetical protein JDV02_006267 [Purpureocillium takamizusanense]|uniref:Uncharacterized protein n=1 Tax=Purpureocillium takamizusanense TaxID=2060973 RepID=A0A9Q8VCR4_9HYPO|nr:uncharacterized protein JDV02_006267 [Purpureocillium takamizusanense]UNI20149.1 hypothetical protein JDV02_006267 [Purpureocillium takamizusanense]